MAVLYPQMKRLILEFIVRHSPILELKAGLWPFKTKTFEEKKFLECKNFGKTKYKRSPNTCAPKHDIDEMIKAGILQPDLVTTKRNLRTRPQLLGVFHI